MTRDGRVVRFHLGFWRALEAACSLTGQTPQEFVRAATRKRLTEANIPIPRDGRSRDGRPQPAATEVSAAA